MNLLWEKQDIVYNNYATMHVVIFFDSKLEIGWRRKLHPTAWLMHSMSKQTDNPHILLSHCLTVLHSCQ